MRKGVEFAFVILGTLVHANLVTVYQVTSNAGSFGEEKNSQNTPSD